MVLFLSFYNTRREDRYKKVRLNIPFHSMGIFALILGRVRLMGLNSHLPHKLLCTLYTSLSHVDVHTRAHHRYSLRILWCISSTLHSTPITINKLQIHHVRVQRCTLLFDFRCSGFRSWTKIFTTSAPT